MRQLRRRSVAASARLQGAIAHGASQHMRCGRAQRNQFKMQSICEQHMQYCTQACRSMAGSTDLTSMGMVFPR